jgi:hypothetical protein
MNRVFIRARVAFGQRAANRCAVTMCTSGDGDHRGLTHKARPAQRLELQFIALSDVSARGTVLRDCVVEGLRFIFTPIGVEDDEETRDDEGACRAGR